MSPSTKQSRGGMNLPARLRGLQPVPLLWLTAVWMALWRDLSPANALVGLAVAAAVTVAFPLPILQLDTRIRPVPMVWLVTRFLYDVVVASFQVALLTLQLHRQPKSAVVAVRLRTPSDLVMTLVSQMISLVPGTIAVEARRETQTVYIHALDVRGGDVDEVREQVLAQERRIARALGMDHDQPSPITHGGPR